MAIKDLDKIDFSAIGLAPKAEKRPQFTVIYGQGGLGKTTAACYSPDPVIIPIGRETGHERMVEFGIPAFQNPGIDNLSFVFGSLAKLLKTEHSRKTVILDNIGTYREIVDEDVEADNKGQDLKAYGRGLAIAFPYYTRLLSGIAMLMKKGINVVLIAHDVNFNVNLEDGNYYSRVGINAPAGENTNVRGLIEARAHNVLYMIGENPTIPVKAGGRTKYMATGGKIDRVIYTKPTGKFFAKSRVNLDSSYVISHSETDEELLKNRTNPTLIKLWQDIYK